MADQQQDNPTTPTAPTDAARQGIPPRLLAQIDSYFNKTCEKIRAVAQRYNLPPDLVEHLIADLRGFIYNDYTPLKLTVEEITRLGAGYYDVAGRIEREDGLNHTLRRLFLRYANFAAVIRLRRAIFKAPAAVKPLITTCLERRVCMALDTQVEQKLYYEEVPTDEDYLRTAAINFSEFLSLAVEQEDATAAELHQVRPPQAIFNILGEEQVFSLKDEIIANFLSIKEYPIESIKEYDKRVDAHNKRRRELLKAEKEQEKNATTQAEAGKAIADKIITIYQPNAVTLSKPIDAICETTEAIVGLGRRPQPLGAILTALSEKYNTTPKMVRRCLEGLTILAQRKESGKININGNWFYFYDNLNVTEILCLITGLNHPNGSEWVEAWQALSLLTNLRIGHDEDHIIDGKVVRYRHFTQMVNIPEIKAALNTDEKAGRDIKLLIQIHRLIKTGRRAELVDDGNGLEQIATPRFYKVSKAELDKARKLFKGEAGIKFYYMLTSGPIDGQHIKESTALAQLWGYDDEIAAAEQQGKQIMAAAEEAACRAETEAIGDKILTEAKEKAKQIIKAAKVNIQNHRGRDRERLNKWFELAAENKIIDAPVKTTEAKDGSGDKVLTWTRKESATRSAKSKPEVKKKAATKRKVKKTTKTTKIKTNLK